jgi:hypothetical protein
MIYKLAQLARLAPLLRMRKFTWVVAIALLLLTGFVGIKNGIAEWNQPTSLLQRTVTIGVALYGILGLSGGIGLALRRSWSAGVAVAWAVVITYVATVASFAFHDPSFSQSGTLTGTLAAGIVTALIGWFVVWTARVATRTPTLPRAHVVDSIHTP